MLAGYAQKMHFHAEGMPAVSVLLGFPSRMGAAAGLLLKAALRGATGEEQESPKNLKVLLTRSPRTCCTGFLRGEAQGQAGISPPVSTRAGEMLGTGAAKMILEATCFGEEKEN